LIASIANNKRNALFSPGGTWAENESKRDQSNQSNQRRDDRADPCHGIPIANWPPPQRKQRATTAEPHLNKSKQSKAPLRR
jgi:hypothetical protein